MSIFTSIDKYSEQIKKSLIVGCDYSKIESRVSASFIQEANYRGKLINKLEEKESIVSDYRILYKLANQPLFKSEEEENKLLTGVVYHLIWFLKKGLPKRRKKAFYRKLGKIYSVDRKKLQKQFEKLYPLISTHKKLFPNKFNLYGRLGPVFSSKRLKKFVNRTIFLNSHYYVKPHI